MDDLEQKFTSLKDDYQSAINVLYHIEAQFKNDSAEYIECEKSIKDWDLGLLGTGNLALIEKMQKDHDAVCKAMSDQSDELNPEILIEKLKSLRDHFENIDSALGKIKFNEAVMNLHNISFLMNEKVSCLSHIDHERSFLKNKLDSMKEMKINNELYNIFSNDLDHSLVMIYFLQARLKNIFDEIVKLLAKNKDVMKNK